MAIKKDTLHPEGEVGVDIYPKTSIDQVENLQANLDALNGDIANANGEISAVSNRVNANERNITDLQQDVDKNIMDIATAERNITDLQNYVNQNVEDLYMILEQAQVVTVTLSAATPIELAEYDVAYPETGEIQRQSKTIVFDGTESWNEVSSDTRYQYISTLPVLADKDDMVVISNLFVTNSENGISLIGETSDGMTSVRLRGNKTEHPEFDTVDEWKAYLAAQFAAGNPLTVTYQTAKATTEATPFDKSKYIAWKNGSETIEQGANDNSEYGAEDTVKQDYFTLTGGTTNV